MAFAPTGREGESIRGVKVRDCVACVEGDTRGCSSELVVEVAFGGVAREKADGIDEGSQWLAARHNVCLHGTTSFFLLIEYRIFSIRSVIIH